MKGWEIVIEIKRLLSEGLEVSEVARRLKVDRKTVRKYRDLDMEGVAAARRRGAQRSRKVSRFKEVVKQRVEAMAVDGIINAQAIYEELKTLGYRGSARSLRRHVSGLRSQASNKRVYQPFETPPGHQAMVDLGEKRRVRFGDGVRTVHFAAMVLSHSRRKYVEWCDRPIDTEMFLGFHERAFECFEGIPREIVYDQTKLAVIAEQYGEVEFNEAFHGYAHWRGFKPWICRKSDPETKGKIEAVVRYVKRGFLPGRCFDDLTDLERQSNSWLRTVADAKPHETTGVPPLELWQEEKAHLRPLSGSVFAAAPAFRVQRAHGDGLVKVLGNRYSVPKSHHGAQVKVRVTEQKVEIRTLDGQHLHSHWRSHDKGKRFIVPEHYRRAHAESSEALIHRLTRVYGDAELAEALRRSHPRHFRDQCRGLIRLADQFPPGILREACRRVLRHGCASFGNLKKAALHLRELGAVPETASPDAVAVAPLPQNIGVEARPCAYYDQAALEEETLP